MEDRTEHGKANRHHLVMVLMLLLLLGGALVVVRTGARAAVAQERIATVTWEGVGRRRERGMTCSPRHARCIVSSHVDGLLQNNGNLDLVC